MKNNQLAMTLLCVAILSFNCGSSGSADENPKDNSAPVASGVSISGTAQVGQILTGNYTYSDAENDTEGSSVFKWLEADNATGTYTAIVGAVNKTFGVSAAQLGKFIKFEVTPIASGGTTTGTAVLSTATSAVAAGADVTAPTITSISPANNLNDVALNAVITITFNEAMTLNTLTGQTSTGACSGNIQISADNFVNCFGFSGSMATGTNPYTLTPAGSLSRNTQYKIRVTTGVKDLSGNALAAESTQGNGFYTLNKVFPEYFYDTTGKNVFVVYTSDGATNPDKTNGTSVSASFDSYMDPERRFSADIPGGPNIRYVYYISNSDLANAYARTTSTGYTTSWIEGDSYLSNSDFPLYVNYNYDTTPKNVFIVYTTNGTVPTKTNGSAVPATFDYYDGSVIRRFRYNATVSANFRYVFYISDSDLASAYGRNAARGLAGYATSWVEGDNYLTLP